MGQRNTFKERESPYTSVGGKQRWQTSGSIFFSVLCEHNRRGISKTLKLGKLFYPLFSSKSIGKFTALKQPQKRITVKFYMRLLKEKGTQ